MNRVNEARIRNAPTFPLAVHTSWGWDSGRWEAGGEGRRMWPGMRWTTTAAASSRGSPPFLLKLDAPRPCVPLPEQGRERGLQLVNTFCTLSPVEQIDPLAAATPRPERPSSCASKMHSRQNP